MFLSMSLDIFQLFQINVKSVKVNIEMTSTHAGQDLILHVPQILASQTHWFGVGTTLPFSCDLPGRPIDQVGDDATPELEQIPGYK